MCGSSARTDLYGGQLAIAVPTVTDGLLPNSSGAQAMASVIAAQIAQFDVGGAKRTSNLRMMDSR